MENSATDLSDAPDVTVPPAARRISEEHPDLWTAFQQLGTAASDAGPLDKRERRLVHLAFAIGANSQGATHSHVRRGLADGLDAAELEHVALLAITTIGWPQAVKGLTWIADVTRPRTS